MKLQKEDFNLKGIHSLDTNAVCSLLAQLIDYLKLKVVKQTREMVTSGRFPYTTTEYLLEPQDNKDTDSMKAFLNYKTEMSNDNE